MPTSTPSVSFQQLRNYMEKFCWVDPHTGLKTTGYNPPKSVKKVSRVPFFVKYVTVKGRFECGNAVCLKVFPRKHQRMIQFVESKEIRIIRDYLVIEVDGMSIVTH